MVIIVIIIVTLSHSHPLVALVHNGVFVRQIGHDQRAELANTLIAKQVR
jgi:hypothetical protein